MLAHPKNYPLGSNNIHNTHKHVLVLVVATQESHDFDFVHGFDSQQVYVTIIYQLHYNNYNITTHRKQARLSTDMQTLCYIYSYWVGWVLRGVTAVGTRGRIVRSAALCRWLGSVGRSGDITARWGHLRTKSNTRC